MSDERGASWGWIVFAVAAVIWIVSLRVRVENLKDHVRNLQRRVGQLEATRK